MSIRNSEKNKLFLDFHKIQSVYENILESSEVKNNKETIIIELINLKKIKKHNLEKKNRIEIKIIIIETSKVTLIKYV